MKIGVVTVHDSANYGSFLQAYAMQHILQSMGHNVYFIRTRDKKYVKKLFYSNRLLIGALLKPPIIGLFRYYAGIKKFKIFKSSLDCFQVIETFDEINLDKIILGSDEIWNVCTKAFQKKIFYGIGMNNVSSYAVSMGNSKLDDIKRYPYIVNAITSMDNILVRDASTQQIVNQISRKEPNMVCDPTILVNIEIFDYPFHDQYLSKNKYLLVYTYGVSKEIKNKIIRFAREKELKIVSAGFYFGWCDYNIICSPLEFCHVLKHSEYIVTTTFHGSIFSILYQKNFVAISSSQKVIDIISKVGLNESILSEDCSYEDLESNITRNNFNYDVVDKIIDNMRSNSLNLLLLCLKGENINGNLL